MTNTFRGKIIKHNYRQIITNTVYSYLDVMNEAGGMLSLLWAIFYPLATYFSQMRFEIGVIGLLF